MSNPNNFNNFQTDNDQAAPDLTTENGSTEAETTSNSESSRNLGNQKNSHKGLIIGGIAGLAAVAAAGAIFATNGGEKKTTDTTPKTEQTSKAAESSATESSADNGANTEGGMTLAEFTQEVKNAGYTIISGTDNDGKQISGAAKESDGSFFVNVDAGGHTGIISGSNGGFILKFQDLNNGIAEAGQELPTKDQAVQFMK